MLASTARRLSQAAAAQAHYSSNLQQLLRGAMVCCSPSSSSSSSGIGNVVVGVASTSAPTTHSFASAPAELAPRPYDVPEGHAKSDLSPHVCNIGLNRRRDLTLRADVLLYGKQASGTSLASLFKGKRVVVFGVPDMGSVCADAHVPSYVETARDLGDAGVDAVYCVASAPAQPVDALAWGASVLEKAKAKVGKGGKAAAGSEKCKIETLADRDGSFARMLGVDAPVSSPVPTHRYAALVEDGILLKLKVEPDPSKCDNTRGSLMLQCAKEFFHD